MSREMIERVARALAHSAGAKMLTQGQSVATREFGWDASHRYVERYVEAHWKEHVHAAGFAIQAMREPTFDPEAVSYHAGMTRRDWWQAMVDAALSNEV